MSIYSQLGMIYPDGKPILRDDGDLLWRMDEVLTDPANWIVAQDHVGRYWLSTIWLSAHFDGLAFETALFTHDLDENGELTDAVDDFGDPIGVEILCRHRSWYVALRFHLLVLTVFQLRYALPAPHEGEPNDVAAAALRPPDPA